jgi:glycerophosphoryl diester phosphodiesterase
VSEAKHPAMPSFAVDVGDPRKAQSASSRRLRLLALCLLLAFALFFSLEGGIFREPQTVGGRGVAITSNADLIGHAGIGMPEATYSNSLEALDLAVARGFTKIEFDFQETSDGKLVAAHDWGQTYRELRPALSTYAVLATSLFGKAPSHAEFMSAPLRGNLTPVDAPLLAAWLKRHPNVRIVTDVKGDNVAALRQLLDSGIAGHQLVPQIYHRKELQAVRSLGFQDIIYTLYRDTSVSIPEAIEFARANKVAVTMHGGRATRHILGEFKKAGVPIYLHTVNDPQIAATFLSWGATGVYTDFLYKA